MPQIEEYTPQTEGQGPVGGIDPKIEASGLFGRGLENLGQSISKAGDLIYRRTEQKEVADTYATFAQGRTDWNQKLQEQTADGTLDVDQFKSDYQDWVDSQRDKITTAGGADFFDRQSARLGGSLLKNAALGQAQVAGAKARDDFNTALNNNSNAIMADPSPQNFDDVYGSHMEALDAQVQTGAIKPQQAEVMKKQIGSEYAKAQIQGYAQMATTGQTDADGKPISGPSMAKIMLDSGISDDLINSDQKMQLYGMIKTAAAAQKVAKDQSMKDYDEQVAAAKEAFQTKVITDALQGKVTPVKDIISSPLNGYEQDDLLKRVQGLSKLQQETNPYTYNRTLRQIYSGQITTTQQLLNVKGIGGDKLEGLLNQLPKAPGAKEDKADRALLIKTMGAKLLQKNPATGVVDPQGHVDLANKTLELEAAEKSRQSQGLPLKDLYDPSSKDYFGNKVQAPTTQQLLDRYAQQFKSAQTAPPALVTTPPGIATKQPKPSAPQRLPNETQAQYLDRVKNK